MTPLTKHRKQEFLRTFRSLKKNSPKSEPTTSTDEEKKSRNPWFENYGMSITRYLREVHCINTVKGLSYKLNLARSRYPSGEKDFELAFRAIDSIIESCTKWRPYLANDESFDLLVCLEAISMAGIHASVIAARNFAEHQGKHGVRLKEDVAVPHLFATVVSRYGQIQVFS